MPMVSKYRGVTATDDTFGGGMPGGCGRPWILNVNCELPEEPVSIGWNELTPALCTPGRASIRCSACSMKDILAGLGAHIFVPGLTPFRLPLPGGYAVFRLRQLEAHRQYLVPLDAKIVRQQARQAVDHQPGA